MFDGEQVVVAGAAHNVGQRQCQARHSRRMPAPVPLVKLQHGDQPGLYNNLPTDPTISPWVSLWKGIAKPLMALALGVAALGAFFHYVTRGPKEVDESADSGGRTATRHDREV